MTCCAAAVASPSPALQQPPRRPRAMAASRLARRARKPCLPLRVLGTQRGSTRGAPPGRPESTISSPGVGPHACAAARVARPPGRAKNGLIDARGPGAERTRAGLVVSGRGARDCHSHLDTVTMVIAAGPGRARNHRSRSAESPSARLCVRATPSAVWFCNSRMDFTEILKFSYRKFNL